MNIFTSDLKKTIFHIFPDIAQFLYLALRAKYIAMVDIV